MAKDFVRSKRAFWLGLILVFVAALLPRLSEPASRYMLWYDRSLNFWEALREDDLAATYQQYHPGVSTMWASGLGIELHRLSADLPVDNLPTALEMAPQGAAAVSASRAIGLLIAGCITVIYLLLNRITSWPVAFLGAMLLALDPYYITQSKKIHVDALLATFMLISALSWLAYLRLRYKRYLLGSGIFAGLALLTKSPALFLAPFTVLTAFFDLLAGPDALREKPPGVSPGPAAKQVILALGAMGLIALATVFLLWPALWVNPTAVVSDYVAGIALETAQHETPQFLAGQITRVDPGPLLYPAFLAWKTTLFSLSGFLLAIFFLIRQRNHAAGNRIWWYLLLYCGGFLIMMTLGAQKKGRYVLPVLLAMDLLAAWGLVQAAITVGRLKPFPSRAPAVIASVTAILLIQGLVVIYHHPHYGTHHNLLLGGSPVASQMIMLGNQGEGLVQAADYLNSMHLAEDLTVAVQDPDLLNFRNNFEGDVVHLWHPDPDYVLFYINYVQRGGFDAQWLDLWQRCRQGEALWTTSFNRVTYAWLCPTYRYTTEGLSIGQARDVAVGKHIRLVGHTVSPDILAPGESLAVTLYWQSDGNLPVDNHVFVHLVDPHGELIAQHDGVPVDGERPTWGWREQEIIEDPYKLAIPADLAADEYRLLVGMYDYGTKERLPATDENGQIIAGDHVPLTVLRVGEN